LHAIPQGTTLDPSLGVPVNPQTITAGPDGALWFGETGAIGRITTAGSIQQFPLPTPTETVASITTGPEGDIWFTDNAEIGRITTKGAITQYQLPANVSIGGITEGADGNLWFTETLTNPAKNASTGAVGRITPEGQIQTFDLPRNFAKNAAMSNIALGPDGNLWFPIGYGKYAGGEVMSAAIGRITAMGKIKMFGIPSTGSEGSYHGINGNPPTNIISGPGGQLWYQSTVQGFQGIARISTKGKLGPFIPLGHLVTGLVSRDDSQVWYVNGVLQGNALGVATRSGIAVTEDLPAGISLNGVPYSGTAYGLTFGSDGNLWATSGSSIVRISGLDTLAGGLDDRHRPKRAPYIHDYWYGHTIFAWSNVTTQARPTFAGVGRPGAEVTLWAQKEGASQPVLIGQTAASSTDGSWTLKSHVKLSNGNYAVTASQTGDTGPPTVLYSLSNALVIQAPRGD
jgi:streptogramin lyase